MHFCKQAISSANHNETPHWKWGQLKRTGTKFKRKNIYCKISKRYYRYVFHSYRWPAMKCIDHSHEECLRWRNYARVYWSLRLAVRFQCKPELMRVVTRCLGKRWGLERRASCCEINKKYQGTSPSQKDGWLHDGSGTGNRKQPRRQNSSWCYTDNWKNSMSLQWHTSCHLWSIVLIINILNSITN